MRRGLVGGKSGRRFCDLELHGLGERRGRRFVNRDHIDRPGRPWNRMVAWGLFIPSLEPDPFTILAFLLLFPLPLSSALMERSDSSRGSRVSEEVDVPPGGAAPPY
jgi:hypothetical protein